MSVLKVLAAPVLALGLAWPVAAQQTPDETTRSAGNMKAHIGFLASDLLQGREAGSPGFDVAANYVASQFAQLGLKPAGANGGWFQPVPLIAVRPKDEGRYVLRGASGAETPLVFGEDVLTGRLSATRDIALSAPLVFVGFGVVAPERGRDDYRGLDVRGKIVVVLSGAPAAFQTEERAYYANARTKRAAAAARGAIGVIGVNLPSDERRRPFAQGRRTWQAWSMTWRQVDGKPFDAAPGAPALGALSVAGAQKLFAGARRPWAEVVAAAEKPKGDPPRFALPARLDVTLHAETRTIESANVAGMIEGSDPRLKDEVVVLSAHLDHIGVTPPVDGDGINNGALDNAAGVATTLEVARAFVDSGRRPRRSILFLAVTGEEKGLLGAEYFARNPTTGPATLVANVDLDMPILLYDFTDVVAFGSDRSGVGPAVQRAAARMGVTVSPDPLPEEGNFTRSDHYRFVEAGVPAVFLMTGFQNGGEAKFRGFLSGCYHRPCDDLNQPIDYVAGAKFARLNYEIARELADVDRRPLWNKGDFFGTKFAKPAAIADR
ncbi:MAG: M20/M25/M40 family metallo-hydrolase [Phenylobacterium sp.]|uniref:M20/M25/M40 family metallo-hydrolase n=1 Tax=Phenylobacterium sp. TaxID=1871053 RepID=UPI001A47AC48|nr:M20/M25/M40 family metallo-hydrolase [Phenylobacterium sp.]MBL8557043.1 M20/M25/M40 family metallo-hydrolase [Phenylobacterium sp.]